MIAGFLRPQTNAWYTGAHSFLENFIPGQGYLERSVRFGNQWVRTAKGEWKELTEGMFTYDATARAGVRQDYAGGVADNMFSFVTAVSLMIIRNLNQFLRASRMEWLLKST